MAVQRILLTGASGIVGTLLRPRLARPGRLIRLLDVREPRPLDVDCDGEEEYVPGSVTDPEVTAAACAGVDAVLHFGGQAVESDVDDVLHRNMLGTYTVLEAAREAGVPRVVLASSNHAVGFHDRADAPDGVLPADVEPRPDTLYGWSKAAMESVGRLYADRYGMDVICLRIGSWYAEPTTLRTLALWLSPADGARLIEACLSTSERGFRIVWGVSRNTRGWFSLAEGEAIGYHPKDDAEAYAPKLIAQYGEPDFAQDRLLRLVGGEFCAAPLGERM